MERSLTPKSDREMDASHAATKPSASTAACLSDDTVLAFIGGRLGTQELSDCEQHLDNCEACQWLVAEAVHAIGTGHDIALSQPLGCSLRVGSVIDDRYSVARFIARGGMGEVYEAFDRVLNQRIALKTVRSTVSDSYQAVRRLKAEVRLARRVTHANVCRLYDLGSQRLTKKVELHFLSMEYVDGISLREKLARDGCMSVEAAIDIARQVLNGLGAAHAAGTLHRDFKPDNIMLRAGTEPPTPVIMDFGLARALDSTATQLSAPVNQPLIGTLTYMAPEQVEGGPLSVSTDLYAFGIVLFEMLTGRLPFEGDSPAATALKRLCQRAPAPSQHDPRIPKYLDQIVLRCLEQVPERRYQSAAEVLAALQRRTTEPRRARLGLCGAVTTGGVVTTGAFVIGALALALGTLDPWAPEGEAETTRAAIAPTPTADVRHTLHASSANDSPKPEPPRQASGAAARAPAPNALGPKSALERTGAVALPPKSANRMTLAAPRRPRQPAPAMARRPESSRPEQRLPGDLMVPKSYLTTPARHGGRE